MGSNAPHTRSSTPQVVPTRGERLFLHANRDDGRIPISVNDGGTTIHHPKIGILAGKGTSHSWLWFAELLDRNGFFDLVFIDEHDVQTGGLDRLDALAVSGGDTFAVAKALGQPGADRLFEFVNRGGQYIGSCAGAYLPMNSSKEHLNLFNFAGVKITNLRKTLPKAVKKSHKFCTAYGCDYIFHPVREAVRLKIPGGPFHGPATITAPLYGGPGMIPSEEATVLATYDGFTEKTDFLVDEKIARQTLIGTAAAVRVARGKGCFYLLGPHFEHPGYPEANRLVVEMICRDAKRFDGMAYPDDDDVDIFNGTSKTRLLTDIKRELSNSRIVATGMEIMPIHWLIGTKYYEPEKIRVFLESMWTKVKFFERSDAMVLRSGASEQIVRYAVDTTAAIRELKIQIDEKRTSAAPAEYLFALLHKFAMAFMDMYFLTRARGRVAVTEAA